MNILNGNYAKAVNYFTGVVVNEVLSFPGNAFVYPSNNFAAFLSFRQLRYFRAKGLVPIRRKT